MGELTFFQFAREQLHTVPPVENVDLSGKTVVIVGANVGLGFEATKHFASMNPKRLVLGCRSEEKGRAALQAIQATGYKNAELALIDLSRFETVSAFADAFIRDGSQIDIFVYNAGVALLEHRATGDGWEETIQVNHLSAVLLTIRLLPCVLKAVSSGSSRNPRVVIVSSDVHYWAKFSQDELASDKILRKISDKEHCTATVMADRYNLSKLLSVFFVRELTKRLPANSPVVVIGINPGYCKSNLRRHLSVVSRVVDMLVELVLARTSEEGSRQLVWAAVGDSAREYELRGGYASSMKLKEVSDYVLSDDGASAQVRVWEESVEILSHVDPQFGMIVKEILTK
ncbi:hypothetical protein BC834DRAFT_973199 [Gloeopeniophorella convolvens]|nr:hypothetical protein BC834DRAFT_973199 [Gloeopeniophorella convolvens]